MHCCPERNLPISNSQRNNNNKNSLVMWTCQSKNTQQPWIHNTNICCHALLHHKHIPFVPKSVANFEFVSGGWKQNSPPKDTHVIQESARTNRNGSFFCHSDNETNHLTAIFALLLLSQANISTSVRDELRSKMFFL